MDSQINVVLRLQKADDQELPEHLSPHVYASASLVDQSTKLDISKAVAMEHRGTVTWELTSVFPSNCETYYRFYLLSKDSVESYAAEECPKRIFNPKENSETDSVVTFTLDGKLHRFAVTVLANLNGNQSRQPSELAGSNVDLEHCEIPAPLARNNSAQYAANSAESPRAQTPKSRKRADAIPRNSVSIKDLVLMSSEAPTTQTESTLPSQLETSSSPEEGRKSRSIGTDPLTVRFEDHRGLYVDRSVGSSPKLLRRGSDVSMLNGDSQLHEEHEDMPEAAGAVAAAAVAERMLLPKERRQLAIVLVGLPARGKTFTAVKLTRYLRWLGHDTKHFNVGKYRRLKHGCTQSADFFRGDNQEGVDARNEVAVLAMEDMLSWMEDGGQIGVFDATNSTKERRNMILKMAEGKCKVIFLETICNDKSVIDRNINLKIQQSPDYADQMMFTHRTDYETARADFKARLHNYEKVYEPVDEGSYIKMIDTVTGEGGQIQVNGISGYLPGRIVFFLVNTHVTPRPILLTRHGESVYNLTGQIGGDAGLSETGEKYALKLANFITKRLKSESTASIWTSTLQRTILTASHVVGFPKVQWRALDEINAGICDGMTYEEIKDKMPEEYAARKLDKLRYRYPRGESYLDVIQRLEPVIIELERQRAPVVVIAHQAVLRSLYAYFADKPLKEIPHIEVPLHTVIEIQMGVTGIQEKRYNLMETGVCEL